MKKLNSSWKVAGFALLFGMALQSCDQVIDNPLSPSQPIPDTPAEPAKPTVAISYTHTKWVPDWTKATTATITGCADTKDVNGLMANDSIKKLFTNATESIEIIVKGGIKIADAIAIPAALSGTDVQITFADAFTEAKKDLTIKNNAANDGKFTVKLPDSESAINLDLAVTPAGYNTLIGNALVGAIKTASTAEDSWAYLNIKNGIKIATFDPNKQTKMDFFAAAGAIDTVILTGGKTDDNGDNRSWFDCGKNGFPLWNVYNGEETYCTPNAIIAEGTNVGIYPRSYQSKAGIITIGKNATLEITSQSDPEDNNQWYFLAADQIKGADRSAQLLNDVVTTNYSWWPTVRHFNIGNIDNVTLPNLTGDLPANVTNSTFENTVNIPETVSSVENLVFNGNVNLAIPASANGTYTFTFSKCGFANKSWNNRIYISDVSDIPVLDESGKQVEYTMYVWTDKNGTYHYSAADPSKEEGFNKIEWTEQHKAFDSVTYKDFRTTVAFDGCKSGAQDLTSATLGNLVSVKEFDENAPVFYSIDGVAYRMTDSGVLVKK